MHGTCSPPQVCYSPCVCVSNGYHALTHMCPHFSSLAGSVRPQDSLATPTSSSGDAAERANMSFLWRLCVSGQLVYSHHSFAAELPCMERRPPSSNPLWQIYADHHRKRLYLSGLEKQRIRLLQLLTVFREPLWCSGPTVEVLRVFAIFSHATAVRAYLRLCQWPC